MATISITRALNELKLLDKKISKKINESIFMGALIDGVQQVKKTMVQIDTPDEEIGNKIIREAITAPLRQIVENAGFESGIIVENVKNHGDNNFGFNAATGEYEDMFKAGIIDPTKVERVALQNAVSVASLLLTTEATISIVEEEF